MYTYEGKRLLNQVLAGKEQTLGSHISLGINVVADASIDGSAQKTTHNRYHSPYIVDDISILNSSVISAGANDEIVFSAQAEDSQRYYANNIALTVIRPGGNTRTQRILVNVSDSAWNCGTPSGMTKPINVPSFTNEGVIELDSRYIAEYSAPLSLYNNGLDDIFAFPLYFVTLAKTALYANPAGVAVKVKFYYTNDGGVGAWCSYSATVINDANGIRFNNDTLRNKNSSFGTISEPIPLLFQKRFSNYDSVDSSPGASPQQMLNFGRNIYKVDVSSSTLGGDGFMRFGSIKVTPDFDSDTERVNVNFRKLLSPLRKTDEVAYTNTEYRVKGV